MKASVTCPKCLNRRILHVDSIADKTQIAKGAVLSVRAKVPFTVIGRWKNEGEFECVICAACGYTEWYAKNPDAITVDDETVTVLPVPRSEPYR